MNNTLKNKIVTFSIVFATLILAGVAVFTAVKLYDTRKQSISLKSPESQPYAWDCSKYNFEVGSDGVVGVANLSTRNEPSQKAKVFINGVLVATLDVPALSSGQTQNIGQVDVPQGGFNWSVVGTLDCSDSGTVAPQNNQCCTTFTISKPTITLSPTPSKILTVTPTGTISATSSPTPISTTTPTPTSTETINPITEAGPPNCNDSVPPVPSITSVVAVGSNSVKVSWNKVSPANSYTIQYGPSSKNYLYSVFSTGNVDNYTINGISKGCFVIKAVNGCMPGSLSSEKCTSGLVGGTSGSGAETVTSETSAALPNAGVSAPTIILSFASFLIIGLALVLAL